MSIVGQCTRIRRPAFKSSTRCPLPNLYLGFMLKGLFQGGDPLRMGKLENDFVTLKERTSADVEGVEKHIQSDRSRLERLLVWYVPVPVEPYTACLT
jgi:hypothetical protein